MHLQDELKSTLYMFCSETILSGKNSEQANLRLACSIGFSDEFISEQNIFNVLYSIYKSMFQSRYPIYYLISLGVERNFPFEKSSQLFIENLQKHI